MGEFGLENRVLEPLDNPFGPKLSPMSLVRSVSHVSGSDPLMNGRGGGIRTPDPLLPKQMRYQTALRPDNLFRL